MGLHEDGVVTGGSLKILQCDIEMDIKKKKAKADVIHYGYLITIFCPLYVHVIAYKNDKGNVEWLILSDPAIRRECRIRKCWGIVSMGKGGIGSLWFVIHQGKSKIPRKTMKTQKKKKQRSFGNKQILAKKNTKNYHGRNLEFFFFAPC